MSDREPRVVWMEDGRLVDATTATRPYEPPLHVKADVQRILDDVAEELLTDPDELDDDTV